MGALVARAPNGKPPHVYGVRTASGEQLDADLIVDATGRRSQLPRWLAAVGAWPMHEEAEDSGFIYYGRFFRAQGAGMPDYRAPFLMPIGTFSLLTLPSDDDTWSVTVYTSLDDPYDFAATWDAVTEAELTPWYRDTVEEDRGRLNEMEALRHGLDAPPQPGSMPWMQGALLAALPGPDRDQLLALLDARPATA